MGMTATVVIYVVYCNVSGFHALLLQLMMTIMTLFLNKSEAKIQSHLNTT